MKRVYVSNLVQEVHPYYSLKARLLSVVPFCIAWNYLHRMYLCNFLYLNFSLTLSVQL